MQIEAIQILLKMKLDGEERIKSAVNRLTNLQNQQEKLDTFISAVVESVGRALPKISGVVLGEVEKIVDYLADRSNTVFTRIQEDMRQKGNAFSQQIEASAMRKGNNLVKAVGQSSGQAFSLALGVPLSIVKVITPSIEKMNSSLNMVKGGATSFSNLVKTNVNSAIQTAGKTIEDRWLTPLKAGVTGAGQILKTFLNLDKIAMSVFVSGGSIFSALGAVLQKIAIGSAGLFQLVGRMQFNKFFFNEAKMFLGRLVGIAPNMLSPLERIQRIVVTIDTSLHGTHAVVGQMVKTAITGVAAFWGPFAGIITKLAFANTIITTLGRIVEPSVLRTSAFFGSQQAKWRLLIIDLRDIVYQLLDVVKQRVNLLLIASKEFSNNFSKKGDTSAISALSTMKFPAAQQMQLLFLRINPILELAVKQINSILFTLQAGFGLTAEAITDIERRGLNALNTAKEEGSRSFSFMSDSLKKIFSESTFGVWLRTSHIAGILQAPFVLAQKTIQFSFFAIKNAGIGAWKAFEFAGKSAFFVISSAITGVGSGVKKFGDMIKKIPFSAMAKSAVSAWEGMKTIASKIANSIFSIFKKPMPKIPTGREIRTEGGRDPVHFIVRTPQKVGSQPSLEPFLHSAPRTFQPSAMPKEIRFYEEGRKFAVAMEKGFADASKKITGSGILPQIASGMEKKQDVLVNSFQKTLKKIKRNLPSSPAKEGPLVGLRESGAAILDQLTLGISSRVASFLGVFFSINQRVVESLKPILEIGRISERAGISTEVLSGLQYAFSGLDITTSDLQISLSSINKTVNEIATPEKILALSKIGISLQDARNSANPALETFLQLSDATKKFPINSKEMTAALDAVGIYLNSNIINGMKLGRQEIEKLIADGTKVGATFDSTFYKTSQAFTSTVEKITKIGDYLERDFISVIIASLSTAADSFLKFYQENVASIRAFAKIAGEVFNIVFSLIQNFLSRAKDEPNKAMSFIGNSLLVAWDGVLKLGGALMADYADGLFGVIAGIAGRWVLYGIQSAWNYIAEIIAEAWKYISGLPEKAWVLVYEFLEKIVNNQVVKTIAEFLGKENLLRAIENDLNRVRKNVKATEADFLGALYRADAANKKVRSDIAAVNIEALKDLDNPEKIKQSRELFGKVIADIKKDFVSVAKETGFDDIFEKAFSSIDSAISQQNWDGAKNEIEQLTQKTQEFVESVKEIAPATKDAGAGISSMAENSVKELQTAENRIKELSGDMLIRTAVDEETKRKAQTEKELSDLKNKHLQEQQEYANNLAIKMNLAMTDAAKTQEMNDFVEMQKQEIALIRRKKDEEEREQDITKTTNYLSGMGEAFSNFYTATGNRIKAFFYAEKAVAFATALINTAMGVSRAMGMPGGPDWAQVALVSMTGASQAATIASTFIQGLNKGGTVNGVGNTDTVPAMLTPGEFVQPKDAVSTYGFGFMEAIRKKMIPQETINFLMGNLNNAMPTMARPKFAFATGGIVNNIPKQKTEQLQQITILNAPSQEEFSRYLASSPGQNMIVNVIQGNSKKIARIVQKEL